MPEFSQMLISLKQKLIGEQYHLQTSKSNLRYFGMSYRSLSAESNEWINKKNNRLIAR